jgi:beta-xylosidase
MKRPSMSRALPAVLAAAVVVCGFGSLPLAHADTPGAITGSVNSSDPELFLCPTTASTSLTLCLMTSQDMGNVSVPYGQNYYPMRQTTLWKLQDPASDPRNVLNWHNFGPVLNEDALVSRGLVPNNAYHLWAPGAKWWNSKYYLYIPDVTDLNAEHTTSRIFLFTTDDPVGAGCGRFSCGYTYVGKVATPVAGAPNGGYASDPNLFVDPGTNAPYLVYANGDNDNCGGLSIGKLNSDMTTFSSAQELKISGWPTRTGNLGLGGPNCDATRHPYMEGPALYRWDQIGAPTSRIGWNYLVLFAVKPSQVPSPCTNTNEAIAYATSATVTGEYYYRGIVMCGSTTEWTNQASITRMALGGGGNGNTFNVFAYHDGPSPNPAPNRKVHLQCLHWSGDAIISVPRGGQVNFSNCWRV